MVILLFLILLLSKPTSDPYIRVVPRIGLAGRGARVEVFVPRETDNRRVRVEVDGDQFYRAFEEPLEGEDARAFFSILIEKLPDGLYEARAIVLKSNGKLDAITPVTFCRGDGCL